jgi:Uma2 family endonuclease
VAGQSRDGQVGADDRELDSGVIPQFRQGDIFRALCDLLPGEALFACPLVTLDGVKVIDVVWIGPEYAARLESAKSSGFGERAPEICVEVLSPSNSKPEMEEKRALFFEAGA